MHQPTVCCVMLTRDRHELAARAVACFLRQTYRKKALLIYDTGQKPLPVSDELLHMVVHAQAPGKGPDRLPVGALRNNANRMVNADIIMHWDDDDWSASDRIAAQVAFLRDSRADAVGYNEMLFWRPPQAWRYANTVRSDYVVGTSLCYWRKTWEVKQFDDRLGAPGGTGEDHRWIEGLKVRAESSISGLCSPRMVARIHGGNTMPYHLEQAVALGSREWRRDPQWDSFLREILA